MRKTIINYSTLHPPLDVQLTNKKSLLKRFLVFVEWVKDSKMWCSLNQIFIVWTYIKWSLLFFVTNTFIICYSRIGFNVRNYLSVRLPRPLEPRIQADAAQWSVCQLSGSTPSHDFLPARWVSLHTFAFNMCFPLCSWGSSSSLLILCGFPKPQLPHQADN